MAERLFQHRSNLTELPNKFPAPEIDITGAPHEIKERQQKIERMRREWVEQKRAELEEVLAEDKETIAHRYATQIQQCEQDVIAAQQRYDDAYRNWKEDHQEFGGDLDDIA